MRHDPDDLVVAFDLHMKVARGDPRVSRRRRLKASAFGDGDIGRRVKAIGAHLIITS